MLSPVRLMLDDKPRVVSVVEDSHHNDVNAVFILGDIQNGVFPICIEAFDRFAQYIIDRHLVDVIFVYSL